MNKSIQNQVISRLLIVTALILSGVAAAGLTSATNATVNFGTTVGTIRQDFYGVNTHGVWGTNYSRVDYSGDSNEDFFSNASEHLLYMDSIPLGFIRMDMSMGDNMLADGSDRFVGCTASNYACLNVRRQAINNTIARNQTVLATAAYMIANLATNDSNCAGQNSKCMPVLVDNWAVNITVKWLNTTGLCAYAEANPGKVYLEVWNEPDLDLFFLPWISTSATNRSTEFNRLYNATWRAVKNNPGCDAVLVGGPSISTLDDIESKNFFRSWVGNFSNGTGADQWDFVTTHEYYWNIYDSGDGEYDGQLGVLWSFLESECASRNADCTNKFILGEWNTYNFSEQANYSRGQYKQVALAYSSMLNSYPDTLLSGGYDWSNPSAYNVTYGENGRDMVWFREKQINGNVSPQVRAPYNATKDVAYLHQPGVSVINWTVDDSKVSLIVTKNGSIDKQITVINKENSTRNVNIAFNSITLLSAVDAFNGTSYSVTGGALNFTLYGDQVVHLNLTDSVLSQTGSVMFKNGLVAIVNGRIVVR